MTSRASSALRKSTAQRKSTVAKSKTKTVAKSKAGNDKVSNKAGKLPEWNLSDLYSGIDAPEVIRDLQKMDSECVAFETAYKGKLAEYVAKEDGGQWLPQGGHPV